MAKSKEAIKKSADGTYYFRANLGYNDKGKRIQKYMSGFRTIKEARKALSKIILEGPNTSTDNKDTMLFGNFLKEIFLPWYKVKVKPQTYEYKEMVINKHFTYFCEFSLNEIEPVHVQMWQSKLSQTLKPSYVRTTQGLLTMVLERAMILGLTERNPSKIVGNVKNRKAEIDFWTKEEFEKVISCFYMQDYFQHFLCVSLWLLFMTGMRIGEATAVQWEDIDFKTGVLTINKTLYYKKLEDYKFVEPKTRSSLRTIALDADTLEILKVWHDVQKSIVKTGFVLSYNGEPTLNHTIRDAIIKYSAIAGVHRIKIHALRHSHASLLIQMGENPLIIKDRLGHEDIQTTLGTYGHLYPNSNFEVASKLKGVIKVNPTIKNLNIAHGNRGDIQFLASK